MDAVFKPWCAISGQILHNHTLLMNAIATNSPRKVEFCVEVGTERDGLTLFEATDCQEINNS